MFIVALFIIAKIKKQPKYLSLAECISKLYLFYIEAYWIIKEWTLKTYGNRNWSQRHMYLIWHSGKNQSIGTRAGNWLPGIGSGGGIQREIQGKFRGVGNKSLCFFFSQYPLNCIPQSECYCIKTFEKPHMFNKNKILRADGWCFSKFSKIYQCIDLRISANPSRINS